MTITPEILPYIQAVLHHNADTHEDANLALRLDEYGTLYCDEEHCGVRLWPLNDADRCDHCLNVGIDKIIDIDGIRPGTVGLKICTSCYDKLLETMKAGS